jgi:DNA-binding IclR family transcriptional regulator
VFSNGSRGGRSDRERLEVFTYLAGGPRGAGALAEALGVAENRLARLLYALVASGLLDLRKSEFSNTPEAARYLVKGRPDYLGGAHELLAQLWQADLQTARSIRSRAPVALHDYAGASNEEMATMLRGMHSSAVATGRELARCIDFSACRG